MRFSIDVGYYGAVRLLQSVHVRRSALRLLGPASILTRPRAPRVSRFSCMLFLSVPGSQTTQGPRLQPGQIVGMDHRAAHQHALVRSLIEQSGAQLLYLPTYSPDFNPIEPCWAKIKESLRAVKARLLEALQPAITAAIATIPPENSAAWFQHCSYRIQLP